MGGKKWDGFSCLHSPANGPFTPFCRSIEFQGRIGRRMGAEESGQSVFRLHHSSFIIHPSPQSPTITLGPYTGDQLSVDHIIPFAVAPQLDKVIANLELIPLRLNIGKKDKMGERQQALAAR
jgi:hypothetical protein